jgi:RAP1 GTPase activating protein 1
LNSRLGKDTELDSTYLEVLPQLSHPKHTGNTTGAYSVYTKWQGYEIMYHVGTYSSTNPQQLERKRHIGNDIVNIIFQDDESVPFKIDSITSHQTHVIAVVAPVGDGYRYVYKCRMCAYN